MTAPSALRTYCQLCRGVRLFERTNWHRRRFACVGCESQAVQQGRRLVFTAARTAA